MEDLKAKYAKEPKKIIKAEVAADKIMELRLRQAGRGQLAKTGESAYVDSVVSAKASDKKTDKADKSDQIGPEAGVLPPLYASLYFFPCTVVAHPPHCLLLMALDIGFKRMQINAAHFF